ncbi:ribosomal protein l15 [Cystoisospora suis]|uniref:Ribosomal protein l15 n=1 Tax=Cystoisospora suis TaxID=483139 RepID=A0A2C6KT78_9APIC|nr:ribosomal protein l15 [Cystoisospora suis]
MLHYLEKMRARGCIVKYIKPLWLIEEEKHLKTQLAEFDAEARIARGEGVDKRPEAVRESIDDLQDRLLKQYRLRETLAADLEEDQQHQRGKKEEEEKKKSPR